MTAGGHTLFHRTWLSPDPERLVLIVHGYAEHSGRYEELGSWLAARGCAVHAYDQQGHGRSDGPRGHVRRFSDFVDDLEHFLEVARTSQPGLPAFVLGHSMGGLVAATWAVDRSPRVVGIVTSGAALRLGRMPSRRERWAVQALRRVLPRAGSSQEIDPAALSRDPEVGRAYRADPLVFERMTFSLADEFVSAALRVGSEAPAVEVPMLLLHGEEDPLCPAEASRAFFAGLRSPGSALRIYPRLRHEIFQEPEREQVFSDLLGWLQEREVQA
ncbi:MAG: alpha/beta hydrolase [Myxococcota bacterium]|nr:alpha/beta hydrolase [Myxococcota bacterium]